MVLGTYTPPAYFLTQCHSTGNMFWSGHAAKPGQLLKGNGTNACRVSKETVCVAWRSAKPRRGRYRAARRKRPSRERGRRNKNMAQRARAAGKTNAKMVGPPTPPNLAPISSRKQKRRRTSERQARGGGLLSGSRTRTAATAEFAAAPTSHDLDALLPRRPHPPPPTFPPGGERGVGGPTGKVACAPYPLSSSP